MARTARSVQFRDVNDVVEAYRAYGVPFFAVWSGPDLLFPYDEDGADVDTGASLLDGLCRKLKDSAQIYTLKVYNKVPAGEIDEKTPCRASFNYQLKRIRGEDGEYLEKYDTGGSVNNQILTRLEALALEVKQLKEGEPEEDSSDDTLGKIGTILNHPLTQQLAGLFMPMLGAAMGANNLHEPKKIATMSGVPQAGNTAPQPGNTPPEKSQEQQINEAVAVLRASDPNLGSHLTKLAAIAQNDPNSFRMFLGMLDQM